MGIRDKNARLVEQFIFFRNEFNNYNNAGAPILDSIYRGKKYIIIVFLA